MVVGGGPTGVEFAAELADLLHEDLQRSFPKMKDEVKIQVQSPPSASLLFCHMNSVASSVPSGRVPSSA